MLTFLSGSSKYCASVSTITPPTSGSVCFWIIPTTIANNTNIITFSTTSFYMRFISSGSAIQYRFRTTTNTASVASFTAGVRYFITGTWAPSSTNTIGTLFINAVQNQTATVATSATGASTLYVASASAAAGFLSASIEDLRFYNRVLSLPEIETIYHCRGVDSVIYGLTDRWHMDEGYAGMVASGTGSIKSEGSVGTHLTPNNSPLYGDSFIKHRRKVQA